MIAFSLLFTPISLVLGILSSIMSRKNEYEADNFAKNNFD
jgi:STE24 endopeptidase